MTPAAVVMCAKPAAPESIAVRLTKPSNTDGNKPYCVTARTAQCAEPVNVLVSVMLLPFHQTRNHPVGDDIAVAFWVVFKQRRKHFL